MKMTFVEYQELATQTAIYPNLLQYVRDALVARGLSKTDALIEELDIALIENDICISNPYCPAMGLAGEVGELVNKIKKIMRDDKGLIPNHKKEELIGELGDVLWYVATLATELDIDLNEVADLNINKLQSRQERGKLGGSGDGR